MQHRLDTALSSTGWTQHAAAQAGHGAQHRLDTVLSTGWTQHAAQAGSQWVEKEKEEDTELGGV